MSKKNKATTLEVAVQQEAESEFVTIRRDEYDMLNWTCAMLDFVLSIRADDELKDYVRHEVTDQVLSALIRVGRREETEEGDV